MVHNMPHLRMYHVVFESGFRVSFIDNSVDSAKATASRLYPGQRVLRVEG